MALAPGIRLGAYEIVSSLGAGGMGEVYKARDTRLDRTVAIKVLPEALASDPQFRERFEREARVISQLDHPHICTLYDVGDEYGTAYLVMQYLDGETLADRLARGRLPLDQAVTIAGQIADALDRAHRAGIVHRDLKPGNIMLTRPGGGSTGAPQASLVDFGLAKASGTAVASANLSMLPTTPPGLTAQGTILGTFQYMAPEQLEGLEADARTDIFAFGAVMYEMVTGKKAFEGKSQASLIAAIIEREPAPLRVAEPSASSALEHVVLRCLAKDPAERWQSARDVAHELRWATEREAVREPTAVSAAAASRGLTAWVAWPLAIAFAVLAAVFGGLYWYKPEPVQRTVRFEIDAPAGTMFLAGTQLRVAVSPDGSKLAFVVSPGAGKPNQLYVRRLDTVDAFALPGTEGAAAPFWSPDGRFIAFYSAGKLRKSEAAGGPPQTLCDAVATPPMASGTWNRDGVILFGATGGIRRVSAAGGEATQVTTVDESQGERAHAKPRFLPDGRRFLFLRAGGSPEASEIVVGSLDSTSVTPIMRSQYQAEYAPPNHLLFLRENVLYARRFDLDSLTVSDDDPVRVAGGVSGFSLNYTAGFSVSENGVLVFRPGEADAAGSDLELRWIDRTGKEIGRAGGGWASRGVDLSPDGKRVVSHRHEDRGGDIWLTDMTTGGNARATFDPTQHHVSPIWSPDGTQIAFGALRNGLWGIYRKAANNVGAEEQLFESKTLIVPMDWSRDGQTIVFLTEDRATRLDLWRLPLTGDRKPVPFLQTPAAEQFGQLSPDGRWLAYMSNDSGRGEIRVQSFPSPGTTYQVSTEGGNFPRWRRDGKEILFLTTRAGRFSVMSVMVQPEGAGLKFTSPTPLFDSDYRSFNHIETGGGPYHQYAVSDDGQRFVFPLERTAGTESARPLVVVLNWTAALER